MTTQVEIIKNCPSCNSLLERVKDQLFCRNNSCEAKSTKMVEKYLKQMKVLGFGPKTIEKLELSAIEDIYSLDVDFVTEMVGMKTAEKILVNVEKSKSTTLDIFLAAFSIPLIGTTAAKKLASKVNTIIDITSDVCKAAGLGEKASANLLDWISTEYKNRYILLPITFRHIEMSNEITEGQKTVCISGRIPGYTKASLTSKLEEYGYSVVNSVTKSTDILVHAGDKDTDKSKKAKQYNITILNIDEIFKENK